MADVILGLVLLVVGADLLVRGASRLAVVAGVPALVIGLTVVAYGTSAPELAVSTLATLHQQPDIALGNVVGSNIFNVLFILGLSALIVPLTVSAQLVRLYVPVMVLASLSLMLASLDGRIGRVEGLLFAVAAIAYTTLLVRHGRNDPTVRAQESKHVDRRFTWTRLIVDLALVVGGLALLIYGSRRLLTGALIVARRLGVSELIIALTIVAAGTSLPELATSVVAALEGERDIAVGNIVGSNIFNIFAIMGVSSLMAPHGILVSHSANRFDIPVMVAVAAACLPIFATGGRISRAEGLLFLFYYGAYITYLMLEAAQHDALAAFSTIMLMFALPLTAVGIVVSVVRKK